MSAALLPRTIDSLKMVEQRVELQGKIKLAQLDRLVDCLLDNSGDVDVILRFGKDEEGLRIITGSLEAKVLMQCQRCMQEATQQVKAEVNLGIVFSEEAAKNLPSYYDPLLLDDVHVELQRIVEEELILSLPIVAKHPEGECQIDVSYGEAAEPKSRKRANPFQVLEQLKDHK